MIAGKKSPHNHCISLPFFLLSVPVQAKSMISRTFPYTPADFRRFGKSRMMEWRFRRWMLGQLEVYWLGTVSIAAVSITLR